MIHAALSQGSNIAGITFVITMIVMMIVFVLLDVHFSPRNPTTRVEQPTTEFYFGYAAYHECTTSNLHLRHCDREGYCVRCGRI